MKTPSSPFFLNIQEELLFRITHFRAMTPAQMKAALPLSRTMIHRYLKRMLKFKQIEKWGRTPWVVYMPARRRVSPYLYNRIKMRRERPIASILD